MEERSFEDRWMAAAIIAALFCMSGLSFVFI